MKRLGKVAAQHKREHIKSSKIKKKIVQMDQNEEELEPLRSEVKWAINQLPLVKSAGDSRRDDKG